MGVGVFDVIGKIIMRFLAQLISASSVYKVSSVCFGVLE